MKSVVLVSQYRFPEGDAGSVRFYHFALTLQRLGYEVLVVGLGEVTEGTQLFRGIPYLSLRTPNRYASYLFYTWRLKRVLAQLTEGGRHIEAIVCGFTMIDVFLFLKSYCRRHGIKLVKDADEWYSPQQFTCGKWSITYQEKNIENRVLVSPPVRVVAISRYLANHFTARGCMTVRIPVYFDVSRLPLREPKDNAILHLAYAGSPGKKDYLYLMLNGLLLLEPAQLERVKLTLIGVSVSQVQMMLSPSEYKVLEPVLDIRGRIPHAEVLSLLCKSDFSILLRDSQARYARAGFPTKVIESLGVGLPVVCNYSSDLAEFLIDRENALIVRDLTAQSFCETVVSALSLNSADKNMMSENARRCAEIRFNIDSYRHEWQSVLS